MPSQGENHTLVSDQTKLNLCPFQKESAQKPYPFGLHDTYIAHTMESPLGRSVSSAFSSPICSVNFAA